MLQTDIEPAATIATGLVSAISDINSVRRGGKDFLNLAATILDTLLNGVGYPYGGLVIPQLGLQAGETITFCRGIAEGTRESRLIKKALDAFWREASVETAQYSLPLDHLGDALVSRQLIMVPIAHWYDRPIGCFWALTEDCLVKGMRPLVEAAAMLIATAARAEVTTQAIEMLAKPVWHAATTTKDTAKEVSNGCREALACSAVYVWELQRASLRHLAGSGSASDLRMDMHTGVGLAGQCAARGETLLVDDLLNLDDLKRRNFAMPHHLQVARDRGWRAAIFLPLDVGGRIAGVLAAYAVRPRGFCSLDVNITSAFAQRLCAGYVHAEKLERLMDMERRLELEAPTIEAGMQAMERVHDADNNLILAQSLLSTVSKTVGADKHSSTYKQILSVSGHVDEAHKTIKSLVRRAKVKDLVLSLRELKPLLQSSVDLVRANSRNIGASVSLSCPAGLWVKVDQDQIQRVFLNFLNNSIFFLEHDSKPEQKRIEISATERESGIAITFFDNGPGIAEEDLERVFDYTFTRKGARGMGFGLAISKRIAELHGGRISASSRWGYCAQFELLLPKITNG